jgi:NTP pyrophosphatase (non-canonical NTP hydrolase)
MDFTEYQEQAKATALYPDHGNIYGLSYCTLGLAGEAGEFANKVKKIIRGDSSMSAASNDLIAELGDVLWYISESARNLNVSLDLIATLNIEKLKSRQKREVVKGSGDNR